MEQHFTTWEPCRGKDCPSEGSRHLLKQIVKGTFSEKGGEEFCDNRTSVKLNLIGASSGELGKAGGR